MARPSYDKSAGLSFILHAVWLDRTVNCQQV